MMWLLVFVGRCRWFWVVAGALGWLCMVFSWFWVVVGGLDWLRWFWLGGCGWFWLVLGGCGLLWVVVGGFGSFLVLVCRYL